MQRQETTGKKEITVLDAKRSNAINIGLTVLPPPRTIKAAILKMDNAIMNREGIEVTTDSFSCSVFVNRSFTEKLHLYARLLALNFYFNDYLIKDLIYSQFFFFFLQKILTGMIPTAEEKTNILEAQMANPDIPLGTAEQFLLTLSSISELHARLSLWLFKLDYETIESVSIRLVDRLSLKYGTEALKISEGNWIELLFTAHQKLRKKLYKIATKNCQ